MNERRHLHHTREKTLGFIIFGLNSQHCMLPAITFQSNPHFFYLAQKACLPYISMCKSFPICRKFEIRDWNCPSYSLWFALQCWASFSGMPTYPRAWLDRLFHYLAFHKAWSLRAVVCAVMAFFHTVPSPGSWCTLSILRRETTS